MGWSRRGEVGKKGLDNDGGLGQVAGMDTAHGEVEQSCFQDPLSGVPVRQLTDYKAHSHHFYFTNSGWWDEGKRLLIGSDRGNRTNLHSIELATGRIELITDMERDVFALHGCVNSQREEAYFDDERDVYAVALREKAARKLWEKPEGFIASMLNCSADGKHLFLGLYERLAGFSNRSLWAGYVGFEEIFEARPLSRIVRIPVDGGKAEVVHEDKVWIGHVNTSPTQSNLITFCHEGPWHRVDNRIWGLDVDSGSVWPIRAREEAGEVVGHEYWHADGEHIGYHGKKADGRKFFGRIRYDNEDRIEVDFPHETGHIHSSDHRLIVGDGGSVIRLWKWNAEERRYEGPRALCQHESSSRIQQAHPHPRFSPAGDEVVFTSDRGGYCNVYLAEVAEFEALPEVQAE